MILSHGSGGPGCKAKNWPSWQIRLEMLYLFLVAFSTVCTFFSISLMSRKNIGCKDVPRMNREVIYLKVKIRNV